MSAWGKRMLKLNKITDMEICEAIVKHYGDGAISALDAETIKNLAEIANVLIEKDDETRKRVVSAVVIPHIKNRVYISRIF